LLADVMRDALGIARGDAFGHAQRRQEGLDHATPRAPATVGNTRDAGAAPPGRRGPGD